MGVETLWCYAGQYMATPEWVCGVGGRRALGVGFEAQLWAFHSEGAHLGPRDDIEDGHGDALVPSRPASGCVRGSVWSGWAACSWRRIRGVVVGIAQVRSTCHWLFQRWVRSGWALCYWRRIRGVVVGIEIGRGNALVLRWPALFQTGCAEWAPGWALCSWRRIRGIAVGIP
jgi:hypothetical protein